MKNESKVKVNILVLCTKRTRGYVRRYLKPLIVITETPKLVLVQLPRVFLVFANPSEKFEIFSLLKIKWFGLRYPQTTRTIPDRDETKIESI